ncbi:MAG TPA: hypothetical protein VIY28_18590 [Pseudonocardiaceae bacterium]
MTNADIHRTARLSTCARRYSPAELARITASMPLLARYSTPDPVWTEWALIFRDHYVENTVGLLLAAHRAGIPAEWVYALTKGDQTRNRDRVHATLLAHGFASGLLDNTTINAPQDHALDLAQGIAGVNAFIDTAHAAGRKVLVIDDGGLLAQGYGRVDAPRRVDGALELTVSGLNASPPPGRSVSPCSTWPDPSSRPALATPRSPIPACGGCVNSCPPTKSSVDPS